jgi:hypothetical protein
MIPKSQNLMAFSMPARYITSRIIAIFTLAACVPMTPISPDLLGNTPT